MDNSVEKPILSDVVTNKARLIGGAKYQKKPTRTPSFRSINQVLGVKSEQRLHAEGENSESSKGKGVPKVVPPNAFGAGIKRKRNGSNALRVKPGKEGGSRVNSGSTWAYNSESNTVSSVLKEEKLRCLGESAENMTQEGNESGIQKADLTSGSGATSSLISGQKSENKTKFPKELEVDLEENAARMLCSLSDQRLDYNVPKPVDGMHMLSDVQESNKLVNSSRVFGPRRREGFVRKRRCFCEVKLRDFNPFSIVKCRTMVYWPLDCSWYAGSVKEYDPVIRKHRVRYDDQEEEWLDLNNERFKLLIFPSDVRNKSKWNENINPNLLSGDNFEEEKEEESDASADKIVETKPIKSLLICSLYQPNPDLLPVTSNSDKLEVKADRSPVKNDRFVIVYSRKRFRNRKENLSSISILASAVETSIAGANRIFPTHCGALLKLNLPQNLFAGWGLIGLHLLHWHSLFLLYHGSLITMSPLVKLEIMVSDNSSSSKYFLFEFCLRSAVSVLCFLVGIFSKGNECNGKESKIPVTSIICTISGLHGYSGQTVIGLFSFFPITNLRRAYLQKKIICECSCMKVEESPSGLADPLLVYQPVFSGVNPMILFMNKQSTSEPSSFILSPPHETMPGFSPPQNPEPITLECDSEDCNNKDRSAMNNKKIDVKDPMVFCPLTASVVEIPLNQISHVVALPAPVQMTNALMHSSTPTAPRSTLNRARASSLPKLWPSNDTIFSKTPRCDTSSQPWPVETGSKSQPEHQKIQHNSKCSKPNHSDYALTCYANVLNTADNRGWRECGAHVVLDYDNQEGTRLCVQFFREKKYFYRANQVIQPGSTNRYTHAMMWRGGRDWSLEFTDRNQWFIFKEMYEECYNRNMRAASIKNIPIPGVRMVEGENVDGFRQPFVRGPWYIRQIGSDIDVALDPSRVMYDMDTEDEEWVLDFNVERELTEDLFERVMDKCEKLAYMNQCTEFTPEQIPELMEDVGPVDVVKEVASYWSTKRKRKDMPLIRHLQPPLWMHYQKLLDQWESSVKKILRAPHSAVNKAPPAEKPPMFAFCLRPRGLQLKRPQKKLFLSSRNNGRSHKSGRRPSAPSSREKVASISRLNQLSRTAVPASHFSNNHQAVSSLSHNQTVSAKRVRPSSSDMPDRTNRTSSPADNLWFLKEDVEDFKLRDAQAAAVHASNIARLKREKAQLLMQKADMAMYKARMALMIADAIKSSKG